jgi:OOP family OmpA-OmpF porin
MKRSTLVLAPLAAALASLVLAPSPAAAQQTNGFAVNRFEPSERGSDWFTNESLDLRGHMRPALGLVIDYAARPLVIYNADDSIRASVVRNQLTAHAGGSLILFDRLRLGASLPIVLFQDGHNGASNGVSYVAPGSATAFGDLRLGADVRLLGQYGDAFTAGVGVQLFVPLGQKGDYTGDESVRFTPRILVAGEVGIFEYAARVGFLYRGLDASYGGAPLGSEMTFGAAAGVRVLDRKLLLGPEIFGSTVVSNSDAAFSKRATPLEAILGGRYYAGDAWRFGAGVGTGLTRGFGAPEVRVLASVEWAPSIEKKEAPPPATAPPPVEAVVAPPSDRDGDGIVDTEDACPDVKGVKTDDPKTNGCPPPPPDRDGDGIIDSEDACPDVKGVKTADPKTNGCPPDPDRDKDGILNEVDACPDEAGKADPDPKRNGCPKAFVQSGQIKILDQVKFATGSAAIVGKDSDDVLNAVVGVLKGHSEIKKIRVEGHTDNVGGAAYNKQLSGARAASVVAWLVKHGIEKDRLSSAGYGMEKPLDDNKTEAGRKNNRRVEFHIEDDAAPKAP